MYDKQKKKKRKKKEKKERKKETKKLEKRKCFIYPLKHKGERNKILQFERFSIDAFIC